MLIIRGTSGRTLIRAVLPYVLGLLAVGAVLAFYLHSTDQIEDRAIRQIEERSIQLSTDLCMISMDSSTSFIFSTFMRDSMQYTRMKMEYTGLFGVTDFTLIVPILSLQLH